MSTVNTREVVLDCLLEILEKKQYSHYVMKQVLDKYGYLDKKERSFIKRVTEGCIERCMELDYILDSFSKVPTKKMKPLIRNLMRMSVYQIFYMDGTPDSAVCNEAVKLAGKRGFSSLKGFVNGVLRNIARNKDKVAYPGKEKDFDNYLSVTYSMPLWIIKMWTERFGRERAEQILQGLLTERPVTVRVEESLDNEKKESLLNEMKEAGISYTQITDLPYAYELQNVDRVEMIPGFAEGLLMVQDAGSMAIIEVADIQKNQNVLDVCGAPGGKAIHAAGKMQNTGFVTVRDISRRKVAMMEDNIARSGYDNIKAEVFDATVLDETNVEKADVVIADLPCSGLGVIGRKADIKYRVQPEDVASIAELQKEILSVVWQYVKPGGKLVYSTCTLTEEENENNTKWFLENYPFEKVKERLLIPGVDGTDGFYMAVFMRK
ncbi:MAG: 16S rRNA (cytosine(967)-C(5))-methyltransferase RsmB [Lachnospiraceae bacterium]|nr:16S rRNA (cytosine(967)-C(5))-methyltransferase RsmB [Lachnospiraceae bacterium]